MATHKDNTIKWEEIERDIQTMFSPTHPNTTIKDYGLCIRVGNLNLLSVETEVKRMEQYGYKLIDVDFLDKELIFA